MAMTTQLYQLPTNHGSNTINTAGSQHQVQSSVRYQEECIENSLHVSVPTKEEKANHAIIGKTSKPRIKSHTQKTYMHAGNCIYHLSNLFSYKLHRVLAKYNCYVQKYGSQFFTTTGLTAQKMENH